MAKIVCHDCHKELAEGDEYMPYQKDGKNYGKCKACHEKDPLLRNFQETEIYSRVVGYIRPVKQWNDGKREEYRDRKEFVVKEEACC